MKAGEAGRQPLPRRDDLAPTFWANASKSKGGGRFEFKSHWRIESNIWGGRSPLPNAAILRHHTVEANTDELFGPERVHNINNVGAIERKPLRRDISDVFQRNKTLLGPGPVGQEQRLSHVSQRQAASAAVLILMSCGLRLSSVSRSV